MNTGDYFRQVAALLSEALGSTGEGNAAARAVFEDVAGYDRNYLFMHGDRELLDETKARLEAVVRRIVAGEPVQYAVGQARFMGMDLKVTPAVLIPRPETEGLCDMIIDDAARRQDLCVLDIGTGSGCIAMALARALVFPQVTAVDVSEDALTVARCNAADLGVKVDFIHQDILTAVPPHACYDIIVSNPPYVCDSEKASMDPRVAVKEPSLALFVPDSDPLRFYRAISAYAAEALKPGGRIYFEINSRFPDEIRAMLAGDGFKNISITRDFKGNYRFARAERPQ